MPCCGRAALAFLLAIAFAANVAYANPSQTAEYTVTFDATWSPQTHPNSFPPNPHFSGLIGGTHNATVSFWQVGGLASPGIENMAEIGSKSPLITEITDAIAAGTADSLISGGGINPSPGSVSVSFQIDLDFPLVTLVSMIAPSPDWFVGVSGLSLLESGDWVDEKIVQLLPYDAGTDSGPTYTSPNQDTNPADPITLITTLPAGNGVPFGTFTFTRDIVSSNGPSAPARTRLLRNVPNPFNPTTRVRFDLAQDDHVTLRVYDVKGRLVRTLINARLPEDRHECVWDGTDDQGMTLPSGTYFYRLRATHATQTRKMMLAK